MIFQNKKETQLDLMGHSETINQKNPLTTDEQLDKLRDKVEKLKSPKSEPKVPTIPFEHQMMFWDSLNAVQYGEFKPEALDKANTWLVTKRGTWLVQKNSTGYYGLKKDDFGIPTLPECPKYSNAFFDMKYGKIPNKILLQVISFFRGIMKKHNNAEAFIQIYWDKVNEEYIIHVPKQRISKASVNYDATENLNVKEPERYVFSYECHSHNDMRAFWSGTDNRDEKELRLYGVFGKLDKEEYAHKHRFFVGEEQVDVDLSLIFDIPKEEEKEYVVTHNNKQYMVTGDKLVLDEKPKYVYETEEGQKIYVPVEDVAMKKPEADVPETWYGSINVPFPSLTSAPKNLPKGPTIGSYGKTEIGAPNFSNKRLDEKMRDPFYSQGEIPYDYDVDYDPSVISWEIIDIAEKMSDMTNGFMDEEANQALFSCIDQNGYLAELSKSLDAYCDSVGFMDFGGPSDGKYSN